MDGDRGGRSEGTAKTGVAVLGQLGDTAELTRLLCRDIQLAEFEELAMMTEEAESAGFRQDAQSKDRTNAGYLLQPLKITAFPQGPTTTSFFCNMLSASARPSVRVADIPDSSADLVVAKSGWSYCSGQRRRDPLALLRLEILAFCMVNML